MSSTTIDYPAFTLATGDGRCALEVVPEYGGLFNGLTFEFPDGKQRNVIAGLSHLSDIQNNNYYRGVALYPFVNRLRDGRYTHNDTEYQFAVNEQGNHNALHGLLFQLPARATQLEQSDQQAVLRLDYHYDGSNPGYPFAADIWMIYTLRSPGELELEIGVLNRHSEAVPVGFGWHPYFSLGSSVDELLLQLPKSQQVVVDERLLPTGEERPQKDFCELEPIADTPFDTCFHLDTDGINQPHSKVIICSQTGLAGLEIWQETGTGKFDYLQVCIPPDRQSIAIEPVSCGIDAFNTKQGLTLLAPGEATSALCGVRLFEQ